LITPLKKCHKGEPYARRPEVEAKIVELASVSRNELVSQCIVQEKDDLCYVQSECLLYFIRNWWEERPSSSHFDRVYEHLLIRVLKLIRNAEINQTSLIQNAIVEKSSEDFIEKLAGDRKDCKYRLDYYEVNFNDAINKLRLTVRKQVLRSEIPLTTLYHEETGEPKIEVEHAVGSFDPFNASDFSSQDYRFALDEAINTLEPHEKRIIEMLRLGFPIYSQDPNDITISRAIGKSEKTIRTYRDKAFEKLRIALNGDNQI
jgi:hypothetical protein